MGSARSRPAALWLQLLLVGGVASVVLILAQAYRAQYSSRVVVERALRDYADFAAWSYREHLLAAFREAVDELLGPVNHGDNLHTSPSIPEAADMGHYIRWDDACLCHRPARGPLPLRYLAYSLGSDTLSVGENLAPKGGTGWLADPPAGRSMSIPVMSMPLEERRWINALLSRAVREQARSPWGYDISIVRRDSVPRIFATRIMPTTAGDTVVYALEYPRAALDSIFEAVLMSSDLLPKSLVATRSNRDVMELEVADAGGLPLFRSVASPRWELDARTSLPESYGSLRLRAQLRPQLAEALLIGGVPRSRVPFLLVLLALAVGLTVLAAVQLRREVRFAGERANFVANVSHELRTPLAQVRLVLDTMRLGRGGDAASVAASLGVADREVRRLQHLVEGVLRFTRGPRRDAPRSPVDVTHEALTVVTDFLPLAAPRGVDVEVRGDESVVVDLQHGALRQMLLNLLDNAVKYGRDDSRVVVEVRSRAGGGATIAVTDGGAGVAPGDRERIWRAFERGSAARQRATGGSGIGLTIVREIAQEHGGNAWVEDAAGGGARFVIELPAATGRKPSRETPS